MPDVATLALAAAQCTCVGGAELHTPLANGPVRHRDAALSEGILDIAQAQPEALVSPHGMTDDGSDPGFVDT